MTYTRILLATDQSDSARRAEEVAGQLAGSKYPLQVTLLYVHPLLPVRAGRTGVADVQVPAERLDPEARAAAAAVLAAAEEHVKDAAHGDPVTVRTVVVGSSDIAQTIVQEADRAHAQAIVMGRQERSTLGALVMGSQSNRVLHAAHCPAIIVH